MNWDLDLLKSTPRNTVTSQINNFLIFASTRRAGRNRGKSENDRRFAAGGFEI